MGSKAGATAAAFHIWAAIACMSCAHARLPTRPAFLSQLQTTAQYHHRSDVSNIFRSQTRVNPIPLFSAGEKADTSQQNPESSEFDARVLKELLDDPGFMQSLEAQGRRRNGSQESREESPKYGALAAGNDVAPNGSDRSSVFESATMQVVEELQDSFRGLLAKVSAALESAGLYVSNRAQVDAKVVQATVNYVSREAAAGPRRLVLAATGAASPALLLMGVNITEAQTNLNDTLQLLSMGIVPDSMGLQPKLLSSLKDFDDDDKRLDAAYRRQRRRRPNPLPVKLLGALPSTINKAADLAYEVEQEVKYERAGSRANKLLKPVGLLLPEARGTSFLLSREPDGSGTKLLKAKAAQETSRTETAPLAEGRDGPASERLCAGGEIVIETRKNSDVVLRGDGQKPLAPRIFGVFKRFQRKIENWRVEERLASAKSTLTFDQEMLTLAARPHFLTKYLTASKEATNDEIKLQDRCLRAAGALLCSTEAIIVGLDESARQDAVFLEELREVEREVQQIYLLDEMAEAVEAAEAHLSRIMKLSSNVVDLSVALKAYSMKGNARMERLKNIMARFDEVQRSGNIMYGQDPEYRRFVSDAIAMLCSFDVEKMGPHREKNAVEEQVEVVRRDSAERATGDASRAHEEAFIAACRLWDASARRSYGEQSSTIESIRMELAKLEQNEALVSEMEDLEPWRNSNAQVGTATTAPDGSFPGIPSITEQESKAREESWTQGKTGREAESARARHNSRFGGSSPPGAITPEPTRPNGAPIVAESGLPTRNTSQEMKRSDLSVEVEAVDATVLTVPMVRDATVVSGIFDRSDEDPLEVEASSAGRLDGSPVIATYELASEIVSETPSFVDTEAEVEDDLSDPFRLGLKFLDVLALLLEKVIFNGLPTIVSGGSLVWERVDNALNGAKGRRGWKLLRRIKTRVGDSYQDGSKDDEDK